MTVATRTISEARAAWQRIKDRDKASFEDWLAIGRALIAGRQECMAKAGVNSPYGPAYQKLIRGWLDDNGLADIDSHERLGAIHCVEHQTEIEAWRNGLSDVQRRRANHPNTIMAHWRRGTAPKKSGPKPAFKRHRRAHDRPVFWGQEHVRRAADAMRGSGSRDLFRLARLALESAIRNEADLWSLLDERKPTPAPRQTNKPTEMPVMAHA